MHMKNCGNCGKQIPDDSEFCPFCGSTQKKSQEAKQPSNTVRSANNETLHKEADSEKNSEELVNAPRGKSPRGWIIAIVGASVLLLALAGLNVFQYYTNNNLTAEKEHLEYDFKTLKSDYSNLEQQNNQIQSELDKTISAKEKAVSEKNSAIKERDNYKTAGNKYEKIKTWIKQHGKEYKAKSDYYAATNVIAVKVGDTVKLDITYTGNRYVWMRTSSSCCDAEWSKGWSGRTTSVQIEGAYEGTTELIFSLGDAKQADSKESFRVLVIVVK